MRTDHRSFAMRSRLLLTLPLLIPLTARAHFPILIHDADLGATSGPVTVTYAVGHPFELEFEPAARPERVLAIDPHRQSTNLTARCRQTLFRQDTNAAAWELRFEPARGDTLIALDGAPEIDPDQKTLYREYLKVCVHRQDQQGWAHRTGQPLEIVPRTRPYGLRPGMVFTGRLLRGALPVPDTELYFERLNDSRPTPEQMPPEPLVTFAVRTDAQGQFSVTFPDPGWWILGAYVDSLGPVQHQGKSYRHEGFAGLWLHVDPPPGPPTSPSPH